ncbi:MULTISPECIES: hypothetical protein [Burkholderia cepacia complex]|nr:MULTISPECIES: hypothetical protein [Burkholderia cepacia complex]AIO71762.1 hypothetical protein DM80_5840 [Burkholderia multivorans]MBU9146167.1 hypothetical protein [Burkholderia multivorans]MBU9203937.1 hypothetical protein [Burkholderia multivorans]MBU9395654.1 hypothetical protein [Burkholderia multivorans]MBU9439657.1 hypothetical protein [Burkholderia multivorans]
MNKPRRSFGAIVRQCVPMAISISTIAASTTLAYSGLASLRGSPGNLTTEFIGTIVHSFAYFFAHGDERGASIWLLRAPIALVTYLFICTIPLIIGCVAMDAWSLRDEKTLENDANTAP